MSRIVQNLLTNAIRYTDGGRILVGVRRKANLARIEVWDTGRGIAKADQETIFREFERLAPMKADMGLGLGLAIVERACKGLGHRFDLWSEPGVGSCFSLEIPIADISLGVPARRYSKSLEEIENATSKLSMLISNEAEEVVALTAMIEGFGGTVIHAHYAQEALAILDEIQLTPDALIVDEAAIEGASDFRDLVETFGPLPCVVLRPSRKTPHSNETLPSGVGVLGKPVDPQQLLNFLAGKS